MLWNKGKPGYISVVFILLLTASVAYLCLDPDELYAAQGALAIQNVRIDRTTISPGEGANISFSLTGDARVTLLVYDPDYGVVRTLMKGLSRNPGTITAIWDGRDDGGVMVPDEAYVIGIIAEGNDGQTAAYDPTADSGGEVLDIITNKVEEPNGTYGIYYSVAAPSRVSIRAGVHEGPLLKTILDWKPFSPGNYVQTWDGMDETGRIQVMKQPGAVIDVRGFLLPQGTVIVSGSSGDYSLYHRSLKTQIADKANMISQKSVRDNALKRKGKGISPQYLVQRMLNAAPRFTVYLGGDKSSPLSERRAPVVSGQVSLLVEVASESSYSFNESRYEIVVFVDNKRFDEEEQAYSPYTYVIDTTKLANGEHWITINLASITGQVGSYSFRLNVNN